MIVAACKPLTKSRAASLAPKLFGLEYASQPKLQAGGPWSNDTRRAFHMKMKRLLSYPTQLTA